MCHSCDPSSAKLAHFLTQNVDLTNIPPSLTNIPAPAEIGGKKLFSNGPIITMAGGTFSQVEALVIDGDTIIYAGALSGVQSAVGSEYQSIDLQQQCMLPGFIEPHVHTIMTALVNNFMLKLSPQIVTTLPQALDIIAAAVPRTYQKDYWVTGFGYDPSRVEGHHNLTAVLLDQISTEYPIYIINQSGHIGYVNTLILNMVGVTPRNADKLGFQVIDNIVTGVLFELAVGAVGKLMPKINGAELLVYCRKQLHDWAKQGCTTIFDAGIGSVTPEDTTILKVVTTIPGPVRYYGAMAVYAMPPVGTPPKPPMKYGNVSVQAVKCWADGSTQGFTAALKNPYYRLPKGMPATGTLDYPDDVFLNDMAPWIEAGFQILVHSNGDRSTEQTLDTYEAALKAYPNVPHAGMHRIEHFTVTEPSQLARAKKLGLAVSHTIGHVSFWGSTFRDYVLGPERARGIDPLNSDEKAGLIWSLHSDSPITDVDPLMYLRTATTRLMYPTGGPLGPEECIDLQTAIRGVTINPAIQIGIDKMVGTLEVGKKADMVILNVDPRNILPERLDTVVVSQTWMGGYPTYTA